jgi:hypothetical protein
MAQTTIITINQLMSMFKTFSDNHLQLNDFGYGPTSEIGTSRQMEFPYLWITHRTSSRLEVTNKTIVPELLFTFIIVDQINNQSNYLDENGLDSDNGQEIISDTFQISQDLVLYIMTQMNQYGVMLSEDSISMEAMFDETDDKVYGWLLEPTLKLMHINCAIPF